MSGPATTSVSNNRPSVIRCKAINSVTVTEIPVQLEPMGLPRTNLQFTCNSPRSQKLAAVQVEYSLIERHILDPPLVGNGGLKYRLTYPAYAKIPQPDMHAVLLCNAGRCHRTEN